MAFIFLLFILAMASSSVSSLSAPIPAPASLPDLHLPPISPSSAPVPNEAPSPFLSPPAPPPLSDEGEPAAAPPDQEDVPLDSSANATSDLSVKWCAVRDEYAECQYLLSLLDTGKYEWSCVRKDSALECLDAIMQKEADLITLDAGLAFIAFMNFSMKAIMAEEYCYHARSYNAVAVVNKGMCDKNSQLSLKDFRGLKSCHPGYRTAAGWNFPVHFLVDTGLQRPLMNEDMQADEAVITEFFSETCAPSEFQGTGLCTSCGNNGTCPSQSIYEGYPGAFRCLMEGIGDIAFLRSDTALRLSSDGFNAQNWSTKSVNDLMYLCPQGGCRPINDNIGSCSFGSVPSNVIMTFNAQSKTKKNEIVETLLNASWIDALYSGKNWNDHLLSASAQNLFEVKELTRLYLGDAASVAQTVEALQTMNISSSPTSGGLHMAAFSCTLLLVALIASAQNFL